MLRQILYDKEISVTLYRPPKVNRPVYHTSIVQGYSETSLDGKKLLYNSNIGEASKKNVALGGSNPMTMGIEFYEGNAYKVFVGYRTRKDGTEVAVYKNIRFSGNTYNLATIEQMKTGRAPSGINFITGDRIYVEEDKSTWTVALTEGSTTLSRDEAREEVAETLVIKNTEYGPKPDIALSINLLPGQNCYGAVLKIRNLNIDPVNIRDWTRMTITAGYRTGSKVKYTCPIFTSYIESPNPDGITTFEGITVGSADGILTNQMIEIVFTQKKMTLAALTEGVAQAIDPNIKLNVMIADDIMQTEITISKQTVYAQNGMAVLSWLQSTVAEFVAIITKNETSAFVQLVDGTLDIIALNGPNKMPKPVERIVNLDMVSGATFNGTALTVEAPWNPDLQPGGLFYMPPEFIYGSKLPNVLSTEDYRNADNLYRALTISVSFATVESTNKMTVLAVPAQWAGELPADKTTEMRGDMYAKVLNESYKDIRGKTAYVGGTDPQDASSVNNVSKEDATHKQMYDRYGEDIITMWGSWTAVKIEANPGDCLSTILERYLFDDPNGPQLVPYAKGINKESAYYKEKSEFKNYPKAQTYFSNNGCKANPVWWPLVTVGTYWRRIQDEKAKVDNNWNTAGPDNPDLVKNGYSLYIPTFSAWSNMEGKLKQLRDIFKYAYEEYSKRYGDLAKTWRTMYYYLGGE